MAKVYLNPVIEGISKQVGELVFYTRSGKTFIRKKVIAANPNTVAQKKSRGAFRETARIWKELSPESRAAWNIRARKEKCSGYNLFIKKNINRVKEGKPVMKLFS